MLSRLTIIIPITPITKKNHQQIAHKVVNGKKIPFILPSKQYLEYEKNCAPFVKPNVQIDYPVNVKCVYYMPTRRRVDLVNLMEATHDILVKYGVLKDDNCNIIKSVDGSRIVHDKAMPRTEIIIEAVK